MKEFVEDRPEGDETHRGLGLYMEDIALLTDADKDTEEEFWDTILNPVGIDGGFTSGPEAVVKYTTGLASEILSAASFAFTTTLYVVLSTNPERS